MIWLAVFATVTFVLSRLAWWPAARHQAKGPKPTVRVAASFLVVVLAAGAEPVMHTAIYAYDAPAVARIDVGTSGDVESGSAQFVGMRERPVSPEGRSTTFLTRKNATEAYDVGTFQDLTKASEPYDDLQIHHALQDHPAQQLIPGATRNGGPSIALPNAEHAAIPNLKGTVDLTPRQIMARDAWNLRNYTNAPNSAIQKLIALNKTAYPEAFLK